MKHSSATLASSLFSPRLVIFSTLVICTIMLVYLPLITHVPLINEETRRALVAKELLSTQHYFYASIANEAYTAKPLLFNWLIILASWFNQGEVSSLTARIPPLLSTIGLIVFFIHYTRRWWSNNTLIFFTVILIFTPQIIRKATTAEIDMVFALLVNLSLFGWFYFYQKKQQNHAWIISCVFVALAYLCKREAALLFYILSIGGFLLWQKKLSLVKYKGALVGLMVVLTGIAVWLVPIISAYGIDVFIEQTANEISARSHKSGG